MTQQESTQETERWHSRYTQISSGIMGGLVLLVLGVFLFLANQGVITWDRWWQYFIIGLGGVFIIDCIIRYIADGRFFFSGRLTAGLILIGVGIVFIYDVSVLWPVITIVVGLSVLLSGLFNRRN